MKRPIVVCLGVHLADVLARTVPAPPLAGGVLEVDEIKLTAAGTAAGTAVDLAKLGGDAIAMGAIGDDALGDAVVALMGAQGVDVSRLVRRARSATRSSILFIGPDGERHTCLFHPGASATLSDRDIDFAAIGRADVLHVGGADALGAFGREPLGDVMKFARARGVTTTLDVLSSASCSPATAEALEPALRHTQYFLPNEQQFVAMSGTSDYRTGAAFFQKLGVECVVVTLGDRGSLVVTADGETKIPACEVDVVDTTGCGDAYAAGFIMGLSNGWDPAAAGWLGSASAALVAGGLGSDAGIRSLDATLAFLVECAPSRVTRLAQSVRTDAAIAPGPRPGPSV
jgi:sugar/nucleoside kinase (ribokinase family)